MRPSRSPRLYMLNLNTASWRSTTSPIPGRYMPGPLPISAHVSYVRLMSSWEGLMLALSILPVSMEASKCSRLLRAHLWLTARHPALVATWRIPSSLPACARAPWGSEQLAVLRRHSATAASSAPLFTGTFSAWHLFQSGYPFLMLSSFRPRPSDSFRASAARIPGASDAFHSCFAAYITSSTFSTPSAFAFKYASRACFAMAPPSPNTSGYGAPLHFSVSAFHSSSNTHGFTGGGGLGRGATEAAFSNNEEGFFGSVWVPAPEPVGWSPPAPLIGTDSRSASKPIEDLSAGERFVSTSESGASTDAAVSRWGLFESPEVRPFGCVLSGLASVGSIG
mmetsp:Transcript_9527/g.19726  ORF Transcript_9527/g.19726 Transcript_9527/m.19726 type:complete len:337 (-) Transcript_9527:559-1569(-)